jgi:plasmid stabilization system protein ParE
MKIIWTESAQDDLLTIRQYLKQSESPDYARKVTQQIRDEVASLMQWPNKGTLVSELEELNLPRYRQLLAGQHRIIFERGDRECLYIYIVCHTSRDLAALLRRRILSS